MIYIIEYMPYMPIMLFFFQAQDKVYVEIEIRDMDGAPSGLFNRGTVLITLTDVNDNPPTFKEKLVGHFYGCAAIKRNK